MYSPLFKQECNPDWITSTQNNEAKLSSSGCSTPDWSSTVALEGSPVLRELNSEGFSTNQDTSMEADPVSGLDRDVGALAMLQAGEKIRETFETFETNSA